jgi:hypothetical protein
VIHIIRFEANAQAFFVFRTKKSTIPWCFTAVAASQIHDCRDGLLPGRDLMWNAGSRCPIQARIEEEAGGRKGDHRGWPPGRRKLDYRYGEGLATRNE